jgi:hypothetical protein
VRCADRHEVVGQPALLIAERPVAVQASSLLFDSEEGGWLFVFMGQSFCIESTLNPMDLPSTMTLLFCNLGRTRRCPC